MANQFETCSAASVLPGTAQFVLRRDHFARPPRSSSAVPRSAWPATSAVSAMSNRGWRSSKQVGNLATVFLCSVRPSSGVMTSRNCNDALNHVGFDCGRPDGILGPATIRALTDFQRNSGLNADGICGRKTVQTLDVLRRQSGSGPGVASIRELESVRHTTSLRTLRIVVGQFGGLSSIGRSVARALRQQGASVMSTDEYDAAAQAAAANRFECDDLHRF